MTLMALIALTVGMVPSIPSGSGAKPKREWRQSQIHANFFKYPPIAVLSLFNGLAALARGIEASGIRSFHRKHMPQQFCLTNFSPRPFALSRGAPPMARLRFLTSWSI
jgi:hypothetical protein